ncbi:hypothetical protein QJS04_geneDACA016582 [Acorus gramineus]|uniref:Uncharacterized protein n=1 Tax=Acorus gramineus TaxID=55184 RepID=A0AAV9BLW1_ACOGR|nr:hypothetical protein QJS04_geneDACA016582 [Acorus gramineus]
MSKAYKERIQQQALKGLTQSTWGITEFEPLNSRTRRCISTNSLCSGGWVYNGVNDNV